MTSEKGLINSQPSTGAASSVTIGSHHIEQPPHTPKRAFWKKKKPTENEKLADEEGKKEKVEAPTKAVPLWRMFRFATPTELILNAIGIVLAIAVGAAQPLMTLIFGKLTVSFTTFGSIADRVRHEGLTPDLEAQLRQAQSKLKHDAAMNAVWLVVIGCGILVCTYSYMLAFNYTSEQQGKRIRRAYLSAVLRQEVAFFDDVGSGEIASRVQSDCHLVQAGVGEKIPIGVQYISTFISGFVIAYVRSPRMAGVLTAIFPPILISGGIMDWALSHYTGKSLGVVSKASTLAEEVFSSIRTVQAFCTTQVLGGKFDALIAESRRNGIKNSFFDGGALGFMFFCVFVSYALAFYYGGILLVQGHADVGVIINVLFSIIIGSFSLSMITPVLQAAARGKAAAGKVFETIDRVPLIDSESEAGEKPESVTGEFELQNVDFHYPSRPNVPVLKQFSARFEAGHTVALVGSSGSGKSTIVQLLERFYDPASGTVTLDGRDIRSLNVRWLRQQIGYVSQEPTLFAVSVRENVEYGFVGSPYENASDEERLALVKEACHQANADGFIQTLPKGYDTNVGERGMLLSGGQKQRVAIARAIVANPRILLLDEATSALDGVSERVVQNALDTASKGRTTVVIAHRLATIKDADRILVMSQGEIVEGGTHNELLERKGVYATLVDNQRLAESEAQQAAGDEETEDEELDIVEAKEAMPVLSREKSRASTHAPQVEEETPNRGAFFKLGRRVLSLGKDKRWWYLTGFVGAICCGMVFPAIEIIFGKAVEKFQLPSAHEVQKELNWLALWYFVTALLAGIATFFQYAPFSSLGWNISSKIRSLTFRSIMGHDIAWFDAQNVGSLTGALADDPQKIQGLFGMTLGQILQSVTTVVGGAIIGLCFAPLLALIGIACVPLIIGAGYIRLRVVEQKDARSKKWYSQSAQQATEAASNIRVVSALTRQQHILETYATALETPYRISIRTAWSAQALFAGSQAMSYFVIALVFYVGALWLADGRYKTSQFFTTLTAVVFCAIQAGDMFSYVPDASKAGSAAEHVFSLLDYHPTIDSESAHGTVMSEAKGHIRFENVKFRYPTRRDVPVLEDLTIEAKPGQYVALVGPSGCGKSTAIQLIERFYDPLAGRVTLDGTPIDQLNVRAYRDHIALVSQEPTLYAGTVRFNVLLGSPNPDSVTEDDIRRACADANILSFIESLPDGFDTDVGGKGAQLSGGQKQRIAIARALIRNPRILLLDEATAALDSASEKAVQAALDNAREGRTVIAIAHRLSTIQNADCIYYLDKGRVAEQGTHDELIAKRGKYAELVQIQSLTQSAL